jgi:short subunit dehydrogenase-like uncharacterized protein
MTEMTRKYDIVVFGATGFTGGKTAEYLARNAPPEVRWAIAGRSQQKLESVKAKLTALDGRCENIGTIQASVDDPGSLARMAAQTRVLLTTVGPFIDYGEPVARACIEQGTDYVDSTGEPQFVQMLLRRYAEEAQRRNVRIVPSCGFDSIPADLGALFTVNHLPRGQPIRLSGYVRMKGSFSGGTEQSAIKSLAPPLERVDPVTPTVSAGRRVRLVTSRIERPPELNAWTAPLPTIDASVVLRSAATLDPYGPDFSYAHNAVHGTLVNLVLAFLVFGSLAFFARFAPLRAIFLKLVKKSGEGPTDEQMSQSWFKVRFIAQCAGQTLQTEVSGGDPGYGETSKMLAEAALCLVQDRDSLPARAGVLTPAEAMGEALLGRLQRAGLRFVVL